ncbi:MAG: DedA family protein [Nitrososphaeria archaeon]
MALLEDLINFLIHLDQSLAFLIQQFGLWTYAILFLAIFGETGLVVTPFFPGDSLLFVSGTFASKGSLNVEALFGLLALAAIMGDTVNYWIGYIVGPKIFRKENSRFLKKEYLERARDFYQKYGAKTIIIARFVPIIRTFAPFVAGVGKMSYRRFLMYNIVGGVSWVAIFIFSGYFLGGFQIVKNNLSLLIYVIIIVSLIPTFVEILRHRAKRI